MRLALLSLFACLLTAPLLANPERPNIVLIMADDMGFSDLGCYGSEIKTPHLDALASRGLRFSQFYNNAKCAPSRASLLTGLYPQRTRKKQNLAQAMKAAGYRTYMVGRGGGLSGLPTKVGFDRYYGLLDGCANYFNPGLRRPGEPEPGRKKPGEQRAWFIDGKVVQPFTPKSPDFYATDAFTKSALRFLEEDRDSEKPFFLYFPHSAPHFPIHAREEDIAKYRGKYLKGWDKVREERFQRLLKLGLAKREWKLSARDTHVPAWESLSQEEQKEWDLYMAVYAGMIDRLDHNIGLLLAKLRDLKQEENTLIFFLSDNGACAEDDRAFQATAPKVLPGPVASYRTQRVSWANASNTPFRKYKWWVHEGGTASPLIVTWPKAIKEGTLTHQVAHIMDLMPTCLEVAGAKDTTTAKSLDGKSLLPILHGKQREGHGALFWQFSQCKAVRQGDWKLVASHTNLRFGIDFFRMGSANERLPWELYNLSNDRTEQKDLASQHPDRVKAMAKRYAEWFARVR